MIPDCSRTDLTQIISYSRRESFWFTKITDPAGKLSNMSALEVEAGGRRWKSTEALYQACRFPDHPDIQELIRRESSPMAAKMVSKPHRKEKCRADWDLVQIPVMEWCLRLKLAFNFRLIYWALRENTGRPIVEISSKHDQFWGTTPDRDDPDRVTGSNVLGKLWMAVRDEVLADPAAPFGELARKCAVVPPPRVDNFKLFGQAVDVTQVQAR